MKSVLVLIALLCTPFAASTQDTPLDEQAEREQSGWYAGLDAGPTILNNVEAYGAEFSFKLGVYAGGVVGYDAGSVRLESEIAYQENKFDDSSIGSIDGTASLFRVMFNGWFKVFDTNHGAYYLGGGIGNCEVEYDITSGYGASDSDSSMAYQIGLWASMPIGEKSSIDYGYRYLITEFKPGDADVGAQIIGIRFRRLF